MWRRKFLRKLALIGAVGPSFLSTVTYAGVKLEGIDGMAGQALIAALREIGEPVCSQMAAKLEADGFPASGFDLHLRRAGLSPQDALAIAQGLNALRLHDARAMRSFSISYNQEIGETGAVALVDALPASLPEIGMVGCDLGDESGEALMQFALDAPKLKMMCIENNAFSPEMRRRLETLRTLRSDMFLVV